MSYAQMDHMSGSVAGFFQYPSMSNVNKHGANESYELDGTSRSGFDASVDTANSPLIDIDGMRGSLVKLVKEIMEQATKGAAEQVATTLNKLPQPSAIGGDIAGMRAQIKANAHLLLPQLKPHCGLLVNGVYKLPTNPDILIEYIEPVPGQSSQNIRAFVVYETVQMSKQKLLKGAPASTVMGALEAVLEVTMQLLAHMPKINSWANLEDRSPSAREYVLPGGGSYYFERAMPNPIQAADEIWWGPADMFMLGAVMPPNKVVLDQFAPPCYNNYGPGPGQGTSAQAAQACAPSGYAPSGLGDSHFNNHPNTRKHRRNKVEELRSPTPQSKRGIKGGVHANTMNAQVNGPNVKLDFKALAGLKENPKVRNGSASIIQAAATNHGYGNFTDLAQPGSSYPDIHGFQPSFASAHEQPAALVDNVNGPFPPMNPEVVIRGMNPNFPPRQVHMLNADFAYDQAGSDGLHVSHY
nr:hypothetical protein CFP56_28651 [Quercus suber]